MEEAGFSSARQAKGNICRLQVSMNEPNIVNLLHAEEDVGADSRLGRDAERSSRLLQQLAQALSKQRHHHVAEVTVARRAVQLGYVRFVHKFS